VVYLLRSGLPMASVRGTAVVFFAVSSASALVSLWLLQALNRDQVDLAATLLLPALAGNLLGQWLFRRKPMSLQTVIGVLLVVLSGATLITALVTP
ncbi:MAG: TSUP family transporter, partial [Pseudomonas sp.]